MIKIETWINPKINIRARLAEHKDFDAIIQVVSEINDEFQNRGITWSVDKEQIDSQIDDSNMLIFETSNRAVAYSGVLRMNSTIYLHTTGVTPYPKRDTKYLKKYRGLGLLKTAYLLRILGTLDQTSKWVDPFIMDTVNPPIGDETAEEKIKKFIRSLGLTVKGRGVIKYLLEENKKRVRSNILSKLDELGWIKKAP